MMGIEKDSEPKSLTRHRAAAHSTYDNYAEKDELRTALVGEQHGICCYCMGRIRAESNSMKIEHWQCQDRYEAQQLEYTNLLGACRGGERSRKSKQQHSPKSKQHCDTCKGNADLKWNPADPAHVVESRIFYQIDGAVRSTDDEFNRQLGTESHPGVLNLNLKTLKNNRSGVIAAVSQWWKREKARIKGPVPKSSFEKQLANRLQGGAASPFNGAAVWWLQLRIGKM